MIVPGTLLRPYYTGAWTFSQPPGIPHPDTEFVDYDSCIALCIGNVATYINSNKMLLLLITVRNRTWYAYSYVESWDPIE